MVQQTASPPAPLPTTTPSIPTNTHSTPTTSTSILTINRSFHSSTNRVFNRLQLLKNNTCNIMGQEEEKKMEEGKEEEEQEGTTDPW